MRHRSGSNPYWERPAHVQLWAKSGLMHCSKQHLSRAWAFQAALDHRARCLVSLESAANRPRDERALLALAVPFSLESMGLCLSASSWALSSISSTFSASRSIFSRLITPALLSSSTTWSVLLCLSCSRLDRKSVV